MSIVQVIQCQGSNTTLIWKHPTENFNTMTQLIVHESQEALFFLNGQALDLFGPGRHTLETQNIPFLKRLLNLTTGNETPFHAEIYFINKVEQLAIKWGTDSKVQFMEPTYKFPIEIGASGEMSLRIADSRKFLLKVIGRETHLGQEQLTRLFRAFLMTHIKSYLAQTIREKQLNIFEIDEYLYTFSQTLQQKLALDFEEYGLALERFFVSTIVRPDGNPTYEKFKELHFRKFSDITEAQIRQQVGVIDQHTQAQRTIIEAHASAQKRQIEGYTYQDEKSFDVAQGAAQNEGSGNFTSTGIGLGLMTSVGGTIGNTVSGAFQAMTPQVNKNPDPNPNANPNTNANNLHNNKGTANQQCLECGTEHLSSSTFCEECGASMMPPLACLQCGNALKPEGKFCPYCGRKR